MGFTINSINLGLKLKLNLPPKSCSFLNLSILNILFLLICFSSTPVSSQRVNYTALNMTSMSWLRVCVGKERYLLTGDECKGGYMFKKPLPSPLCVCGNGVWVLKAGYCDSGSTYVLFAEGNSCYNVRAGIRWIRYIGHPEKAIMDGHFIISSDWDYIEELDRTAPSRQLLSRSVWTMATGDQPGNIFLPEEATCFRSDWRPLGTNPKEDGRPFARIGRLVPDKTPSEFPQPHQAQRLSYCPYYAKEIETKWISGGGMLVADAKGGRYFTEVTKEVHGDCHLRCNNNPPDFYEGHGNGTKFSPTENPLSGIADYPWSDEADSVVLKEEIFENITDPDLNATRLAKARGLLGKAQCPITTDDFSREMDRQTVRMIRGQAAWSLKQVKTPVVALREYTYLQKSRKIFQSKCPEVDPNLLKSILRMFRYALNESLENHPTKSESDETHESILEALDVCYNVSSPNNTILFNYNDTMCPKELMSIQYKPVNETGGTGILRNCSSIRPLRLRFDPCRHDLVLDVTWKVIMFTHYFCSKHFNKHYKDESYFYVSMERLFNPDMLARLYNPGNSYRGMKFVFQMYDLEKMLRNLDRCVTCARDISAFRHWLKRPKELKMCPTGPTKPESRLGGFSFEAPGFVPLSKNPLVRVSKTMGKNEYQCYQQWSDGIFSMHPEPVKPSCDWGMHVVGSTVTYA